MGYLFSAFSKSATALALDDSEFALLLFGLILTIGALGEYKMLPKRLLTHIPHAAFELMVAIGIAGELFADGGVFLFSRQLQAISDAEYAALNKEAGDARRNAGNAIERAGKANKDAGDAKERAGKLEVQAASLRKQAEDERIARVRLAEKVTWVIPDDAAITRLSPHCNALQGNNSL